MSVTGPTGQSGSGGSLDAVIRNLMSLERQSLDKLIFKRGEIESRKAAVSSLSSLLSTLQSNTSKLANLAGISPLYRFDANSSDADKVTATAAAGALAGSYTVRVRQLAAAHGMQSAEHLLEESSFTAGTYVFEVAVAGSTERIEVEIGDGEGNRAVLRRIADALNDSGLPVVASMMTTNNETGEARLVVRSRDSGTANAIESITDVSGNIAAVLAFSESQPARDALLEVDSIEVVSSSNTVTGAIPGVSLRLIGESESMVTIDVGGDVEGIKGALEEFIGAYNNAVAEVRSQALSSFKGEPIIAGLPTFMSRAVSRQVGGLESGAVTTLLELGITISGDGSLSFSDPGRLRKTIDEHGVAAVGEIFNQDGESEAEWGVARRLDALLGEFLRGPRKVHGYEIAGPLGLLRNQIEEGRRRLDGRIEREEERLDRYEYALRQRFAHIQNLVSSLTAQSNLAGSVFGTLLGG